MLASATAAACWRRALCAVALVPCWAVIPEPVITNFRDEDPDGYEPWDSEADRPAQYWSGNYNDVSALSCRRSGDLLFDWSALKKSLVNWLIEVEGNSDRMMQTYWESIRPIQHSLTNIIAYHNITTSRDCILGTLSVRLFYLVMQTQDYRENELVLQNSFVFDWHYYTRKFTWSTLLRSGWGGVLWPSLHLASSDLGPRRPELAWFDCGAPPGLDPPPSIAAALELVARGGPQLAALRRAVEAASQDGTQEADFAWSCPVAYAYAAVLVALSTAYGTQSGNHLGIDSALAHLDQAQGFIRMYREKNDFTLLNLLFVRWPIWHALALVAIRVHGELEAQVPAAQQPCQLLWCPDGGTPHPFTCECENIFPEDHPNVSVCFFMVDSRRKSSLRNITSVLNARFWTLTYGINRLYAEDHGYQIEYVQPDSQAHYPDRKVGWGKVKVMLDRMREYGPERCAYGVSIDSDAYMRTSEPLAAAIHHYGLDDDKLILFSQEYHTENKPGKTHANGGFFIVRNTEQGVGLLEEWYNVPENYPEMHHLKKQNPQGLNLCWDEKMQPRHTDSVVLAEPHLFTAPFGWFVRHNWFKDLRFEQEMMDILLQRLQRKYGCIMCQNVYDWDDSVNSDVGWR